MLALVAHDDLQLRCIAGAIASIESEKTESLRATPRLSPMARPEPALRAPI